MTVFDGLDEICDQWLGIDATWPGERPPRFNNRATLQQLCQQGWNDSLCGERLLNDLQEQILKNWSGNPCRGNENWRFSMQLNLAEVNPSPEVSLERTIVQITDGNWVNQVPVAAGVDYTGNNSIDLVHRLGSKFTFIELKVRSNHPLSAAFQIVKYGMIYVFSRINAVKLGYKTENKKILLADKIQLQVLAPLAYYEADFNEWLSKLEDCLNIGLGNFAQNAVKIQMGFNFSAFPTFTWNPNDRENEGVRKNLLWDLHNRKSLAEFMVPGNH